MALYATNRFAGDGATTSYEFNFVGKYIARPHVKVYQEDDATKVRTPVAITDSNFLNDTTLRNLPVTPAGKTLVIYRDTPKPPLVDFTNGSRFTEYNMDLVARQGLFVAMEAMDAREQLLAASAVVTGPVDDAAAALAAATSASNAAASASAANSAKTAAQAAQSGAETARTDAQTAAGNSAASALAASNSATAAAGSATTANTRATAAATSATNAATSATNAATSASTAGTQATNAANSATAASGSATTAGTHASNASASAGSASTSATNAATSATNAANSATIASTKAAEAAASALAAASSSSGTLRTDLALANGASLVTYTPGHVGASSTTLEAHLRKAPTVPTGYWPNADPEGIIQRLFDRVFIGEATDGSGNIGRTGSLSWLDTMRPNSVNAAQLGVTSRIGENAIVGGSRASDNTGVGSMGCVGVSGYADNNNTTQLQSGYGGYFEARRRANAGRAHGLEIDIANYGATTICYPYNPAPMGMSNGLWIASGADAGVDPVTSASLAIGIINNGANFEKGLLFEVGSLSTTTGEAIAVAMSHQNALVWYQASTKVARIRCDATAASVGIVFSNYAISFQKMDGSNVLTLTDTGLIGFGSTNATIQTSGRLNLTSTSLNLSGLGTAASANGGAVGVPTTCATFIDLFVNGSKYRLPLYNV